MTDACHGTSSFGGRSANRWQIAGVLVETKPTNGATVGGHGAYRSQRRWSVGVTEAPEHVLWPGSDVIHLTGLSSRRRSGPKVGSHHFTAATPGASLPAATGPPWRSASVIDSGPPPETVDRLDAGGQGLRILTDGAGRFSLAMRAVALVAREWVPKTSGVCVEHDGFSTAFERRARGMSLRVAAGCGTGASVRP